MNIKPLKNFVLVKETPNENTTDSGIVLTSTKGETASALIVAVGPDVKSVEPDQIVYLDWPKGHPVKIDNVLMAIIEEQYINAVVDQ